VTVPKKGELSTNFGSLFRSRLPPSADVIGKVIFQITTKQGAGLVDPYLPSLDVISSPIVITFLFLDETASNVPRLRNISAGLSLPTDTTSEMSSELNPIAIGKVAIL
jgi:hypothetical protein